MKIVFYQTSSGRKPVQEFISSQEEPLREQIGFAISFLADGEHLSMPLNRPLSSIFKGLYELRFKSRSGESRVVYFVKKREAIYLLHAFKKKAQKMSKTDKKLILKRVKEILYAVGRD